MDVRLILAIFAFIFLLSLVLTAPVDQKKKKNDPETPDEIENKVEGEMDDLVCLNFNLFKFYFNSIINLGS